MVEIQFYNHYEEHDLSKCDFPAWSQFLKDAISHVTSKKLFLEKETLSDCSEIEINVVNDEQITQIHADFLDDPTPTDVITFPYGELFISADTAKQKAKELNISFEEELFRYALHGIVHLCGYDDQNEQDRDIMISLQESLLKDVYCS